MEYARYNGNNWDTLMEQKINIDSVPLKGIAIKVIEDTAIHITKTADLIANGVIELVDTSLTENTKYFSRSIVVDNVFYVNKEESNMLVNFLKQTMIASLLIMLTFILIFTSKINSGVPFDPVFDIFKILVPGTWAITSLYAIFRVKGGNNA